MVKALKASLINKEDKCMRPMLFVIAFSIFLSSCGKSTTIDSRISCDEAVIESALYNVPFSETDPTAFRAWIGEQYDVDLETITHVTDSTQPQEEMVFWDFGDSSLRFPVLSLHSERRLLLQYLHLFPTTRPLSNYSQVLLLNFSVTFCTRF